jgi:hypothetical protein
MCIGIITPKVLFKVYLPKLAHEGAKRKFYANLQVQCKLRHVLDPTTLLINRHRAKEEAAQPFPSSEILYNAKG